MADIIQLTPNPVRVPAAVSGTIATGAFAFAMASARHSGR